MLGLERCSGHDDGEVGSEETLHTGLEEDDGDIMPDNLDKLAPATDIDPDGENDQLSATSSSMATGQRLRRTIRVLKWFSRAHLGLQSWGQYVISTT